MTMLLFLSQFCPYAIKLGFSCLHALFKSLIGRNIVLTAFERIRKALKTGEMFLVVMGIFIPLPIPELFHQPGFCIA